MADCSAKEAVKTMFCTSYNSKKKKSIHYLPYSTTYTNFSTQQPLLFNLVPLSISLTDLQT